MKKRRDAQALPELKLLDRNRGWQHRSELLSSFIRNHFAGRAQRLNILEAGCGRRWYLDLSGMKTRLTGVDLNRDALELRKTNEGDLDEAIVGDLRTVPLEPDQFDVVYCSDVLEHIQGARQVLDKLLACTRAGGLVILTFPDRDTVFSFIARRLPFRGHVLYYRYVLKYRQAGKPGYGPFPAYYDPILSRPAIHEYCRANGHRIALEYGRPYDHRKGHWLEPVIESMSKAIEALSFRKLHADHCGLVYILQKGPAGSESPLVENRTGLSEASVAG